MNKRRVATKRRVSAKQRRIQKKILRGGLVVFLCTLIVSLLVYILHQPEFRLSGVVVFATDTDHAHLVEEQITIFYDKPRWLLPQDSVLFPRKKELQQLLYERFPTIESVEIHRESWQTLNVVYEEYAGEYNLQQGNSLFTLDDSGYIFDTRADRKNQRVFISDLPGDTVAVRGRVMAEGDFALFNQFLDDLDSLGIVARKIYFKNDLETVIELDNQARLVVDTYASYDVLVELLREILNYKEFQYDFSQGVFGQEVDYVNLRYGNKVIYCYKKDACEGAYDLQET